jgi:hypothetical protein
MPADKQAHVRQQRLVEDLQEITKQLQSQYEQDRPGEEVSWDTFLSDIANGLWLRGWRHPDRIEIVEIRDDRDAGSYMTSGIPACQCDNPQKPDEEGRFIHERACPMYRVRLDE